MKKITIILTILSAIAGKITAQYSTDWIRPADSYQKTGVMLVRDNADNVIVTGYWTSNNIYTRKYDKFGNLLWEVMSSSGVSGNYEKPVWINCDSSNNVIVSGYRYSIGQFNYPNALVILKYDPTGNLLWKNTIPMSIFVNNVISFNMRGEVDGNGNLYIGTVAASPSGFIFIKMDPAGNTLFTNNNNLNGVTMFRSMRLMGNKVVFSGSSSNLSVAITIAWDTAGNFLWTGSYLGQSGTDVEIDNLGNTYLLTSYVNQVTPTSGQDIIIYKINSSGTQVWVNNYDFGGYDYPTRFTYVADKISVIGYGSISASYFDWITFQINTSGTKLWDTRYNETAANDEQPYFITAKANGDVFVTGKGGPMFTQPGGSSYLRMITLKYDNTGVRKWVDSVNIYNGWGLASTLASDSSLYVLSGTYMTAYHFLDHNGSTPPPAPTGLNVSNIGNTSATFSWTPVNGAYLYHLRYKTTAETVWTIASINIPGITISGLLPNTLYHYACEAINNGGPSGYGPTQTFATGIALPVNIIEFNAKRQGANVILNWTTQSEQNSSYFEIQKSFDGISFTQIGHVQAAGYSSNTLNYQFTEPNASNAMAFYRLKLFDADANYKFSLVRVIEKSGGSVKEFQLYPNPATSGVTIVLDEAAKEDIQLQIINSTGQIVKTSTINSSSQFVRLDVSELSKGIYFIKLTGSKGVNSVKLIIN
jgi:Secretion system C-terminal sorting domain/Fibronectin type III domain